MGLLAMDVRPFERGKVLFWNERSNPGRRVSRPGVASFLYYMRKSIQPSYVRCLWTVCGGVLQEEGYLFTLGQERELLPGDSAVVYEDVFPVLSVDVSEPF